MVSGILRLANVYAIMALYSAYLNCLLPDICIRSDLLKHTSMTHVMFVDFRSLFFFLNLFIYCLFIYLFLYRPIISLLFRDY